MVPNSKDTKEILKDIAIEIMNLAVVLSKQHKYDQAESLVRRSLQMSREMHGLGHPENHPKLHNLGEVLRCRTNRGVLRAENEESTPPTQK